MIFGQEKCEAISLPACAPAALLQKVVPGPDPLKEGSSRVEPLVVRLGAVNLHLIEQKTLLFTVCPWTFGQYLWKHMYPSLFEILSWEGVKTDILLPG